MHAILTLMESVIDHVMDIFELYCLRSIFVITPEQSRRITLRHHRGLDLRAEEVWDGEAPAGPVPVVPEGEEALHRKIASVRPATYPGTRNTAPISPGGTRCEGAARTRGNGAGRVRVYLARCTAAPAR